jgi:ketosteroid isomerase-like protein
MSAKSNRELLQDFVDAFNRFDIDTLVADLDPDVELHEWPEGVGSTVYRGPDGVREALSVWFEVWEWMKVEVTDVQEEEDRVLVTLHQHAKGRASEVEVEIDSYNVYRFADGTVTSIELFTDRDAAVDAFDKPKERAGQEQ